MPLVVSMVTESLRMSWRAGADCRPFSDSPLSSARSRSAPAAAPAARAAGSPPGPPPPSSGPSSTASSISTLRRTGRQCITMPLPPRVEREPVRRSAASRGGRRAARPPRCGLPNSFTDPHDFTYTASAPTSASSGSSMMWTNSPPRLLRQPADERRVLGIQLVPRRAARSRSPCPARAAASAALAGTAVGSALGCQAQVQHEALARGLAQLLPQRHRVGQRLAGVAARRLRG